MADNTVLSDEVEARLEMAAVLTQQQLQYARGIVASAGISNPEITAAVVHALAINYAAQAAMPAPKSRTKRAPAVATKRANDPQIDLLMPDPFDARTL